GNLWGKKKYIATCSAELFEQFIRIIICFILLCGIFPNINGEIGAALSLSIACIFSCVFVVILYLKSGGKFKKPTGYKTILKSSTPITGIRISSSLIQPIVSLVVPMQLVAAGYTSSQALSLFGIASGMTLPLLYIPLTIIGSLAYALVPDLSSANAKNDEHYISSRVVSSILFSLFISFFIVPLFMGAGENIGIFFFDNAQSGILLTNSAWVIIPLCLTNISSSILNSVGLEVKSFKHYIIGGIVMLVCIWVLPKYVGINALIWAMGGCFTISAILNIKMIKKQVCPTLKIKKYFITFLLFLIPTAAITSFTTNLLSLFIPLFFNLAISCGLGACFFIMLCWIFNIFKFGTIIVWLKNNNIILRRKKIKHKV
ncbi:MAG: polysaccharide biosynthesis C-terminal domain-containing protein, partial [Clostridia bacterium]|nr:polysaccharide biosynthesis C-terminal domain-containing protein [Clostridia bacterium]